MFEVTTYVQKEPTYIVQCRHQLSLVPFLIGNAPSIINNKHDDGMARILKKQHQSWWYDDHRLTICYVAKVFYQTRGPWGPKHLSLEHDIILLCLVTSIKINRSLHGSCRIPVGLFIPKRDPSIVLVKASERTLLGFNSGNNTVSGQRGMPKPNWRQWKQSAEMPTRARRELGARPDHTWTIGHPIWY